MRVTEIQRFCMHDGPGVRTAVFLKGCPLRCEWCHNPETQSPGQEILFYPSRCVGCLSCAAVCPSGALRRGPEGRPAYDRAACKGCAACASVCPSKALAAAMTEMTVEQVFEVIGRDRAFYGNDGGMTLSGGEPLLQGGECLKLLEKCREAGIGTAVETCGFFDPSLIPALASRTDLLLWDYKDSDDGRLRRYTGAPDRRDVENLIACDRAGISSVLRCVMVKGVNTGRDRAEGVVSLFGRLINCRYVELLPYHPFGDSKAAALGRETRGDASLIPSAEDMDNFAGILAGSNIRVKYRRSKSV